MLEFFLELLANIAVKLRQKSLKNILANEIQQHIKSVKWNLAQEFKDGFAS